MNIISRCDRLSQYIISGIEIKRHILHELLECQAIRRIDAGSLSDDDVERLGITLMKQAEEIEKLRKEFNLEEEDLNLDLGPLGRLL